MKQDETQDRGPADQAPGAPEDRREAERLARRNRKTQRKMQRRAEAARSQTDRGATPPQPAALAARAATLPLAAPSPNPVGQLAGRVGRIGGKMVLKQIIRMLMGAVLRR